MKSNYHRQIASLLWMGAGAFFVVGLVLGSTIPNSFLYLICSLGLEIFFVGSVGYSMYVLYVERKMKNGVKEDVSYYDLMLEEADRKEKFRIENFELKDTKDLSLTLNDRLFKISIKSLLLGIFIIVQAFPAMLLTEANVEFLDNVYPEQNLNIIHIFYYCFGIFNVAFFLLGGYLIFFVNTNIKDSAYIYGISTFAIGGSLFNAFIILFIPIVGSSFLIGILFVSSMISLVIYFVGNKFSKLESDIKIIYDREVIDEGIVTKLKTSNIKVAKAIIGYDGDESHEFSYEKFWSSSFFSRYDKVFKYFLAFFTLIMFGFWIWMMVFNATHHFIGHVWDSGWYMLINGFCLYGILSSIYMFFFLIGNLEDKYRRETSIGAKVAYWFYFAFIIISPIYALMIYIYSRFK